MKKIGTQEWRKALALAALLLLCFAAGLPRAFAESSVITIENAEKTSYRKNADTGNEEVVLTGSVKISVASGDTKVSISAVSVTYDRKTNMLFAQGSVTLTQEDSSEGGQNITADTLLFNTSTMEGIFDNGRIVQTQSDAINLPSNSTLVVSSSLFARDSSETVAFKNGELTFCPDLNPHWRIKASTIWLLPGGEFAFFNAVLFVGAVPLLYLPAFYYPKDELVFNPSFGHEDRRGYYTQTTTYLLGRKPLDSSSDDDDDDEKISSGLYNFMKPSTLKEQRQEGLVLHNLDEDYSGSTTDYLKVMADCYSNLGYMIGLDGVYHPEKYITDIEGGLQLGFSNTIFKYTSSNYSPIASSGRVYNDSSVFLGQEFPFRFQGNFKMTLSKPFSLTVSLPVYSDPFFVEDFGTRNESMDWIGYFLSGTEDDDDDDDDDTSAQISSFTWSLSGSYSQTVPAVLKPYLTTLSVSSFSSSIVFSSKTDEDISDTDSLSTYSPERQFFYPSSITPFKITAKIAGSIINTSYTKSVAKAKTPSFSYALKVPEELNASEDGTGETDSSEETDKSSVSAEKEEGVLEESDLPELDVSSLLSTTSMEGLAYSLSYSITPQYTSQISYSSTAFSAPDDFTWKDYQSSYYQVKIPVVLTSALSYDTSFVSMSNSLTFNPVYQEHPELNNYTETSAASIKKTDYNARKLDLTNDNSISFRPFQYNSHFKNTGLDWNSTVELVRTEFIGDADNPEWEYLTMDVTDDDCITEHTLSGTLGVNETDDFYQTLVLSTTLPPQLDEYYGTLTLGFPYVTAVFASGIEKVEDDDDESLTYWEREDFKQSVSVKLFDSALTFSESFNYAFEDDDDSEDPHPDALKFSLAWSGLQVSYTQQYTYDYDFDSDSGWVPTEDKYFLPQNISIAYAPTKKTFYRWLNRIKIAPGVNTSFVWDCQRPTNSYFKFVPNLTFEINDFLDLTFSAESRNSRIYSYFYEEVDGDFNAAGFGTMFKDLFNSFKFWSDDAFWDPDQTARKKSGFKLKSLSITVSHALCDWDLAASYTFSPRVVTDSSTNTKSYNYDPYFSLSVTWRPLSSMKTEIVDDYGTWELNP